MNDSISASFCSIAEKRISDLLEQKVGHEFFNPHFADYLNWIAPLKRSIQEGKPTIITIAGSNGKGETAFSIAHHLQINNKKFALWTSPHVLTVKERFYSHQGHISYDQLEQLVRNFSLPTDNFQPSYYEFLFAVFLHWSLLLEIDFLILEVGLGGRLDGVNALDCDIAVFPSISREHTKILGKRYDQILQEKLAVMRADCIVLSSFPLFYLQAKTAKFASSLGCSYRDLYQQQQCSIDQSYSKNNQCLAKAVIDTLSLDSSTTPKYLGRGRLERLSFNQQHFIFVGAHNLDGVRQFRLEKGVSIDLLLLAFSARSKKEIKQICKLFSKIDNINKIIITSFSHPKAAELGIVKDVSNELGITFVENWQELLFQGDNSVLVSGSYYFIGEVQRHLFTSN